MYTAAALKKGSCRCCFYLAQVCTLYLLVAQALLFKRDNAGAFLYYKPIQVWFWRYSYGQTTLFS